MIYIIKNLAGETIYTSTDACCSYKDAVQEAVKSGISLAGASLGYASLYDIDLSGGDFKGARLYEACLRGTNLIGSHLDGADLTGADIRCTILDKNHSREWWCKCTRKKGENLE